MIIDVENNKIELYWDDLSEETKKELLGCWGHNCNFDVFPFIVFRID